MLSCSRFIVEKRLDREPAEISAVTLLPAPEPPAPPPAPPARAVPDGDGLPAWEQAASSPRARSSQRLNPRRCTARNILRHLGTMTGEPS